MDVDSPYDLHKCGQPDLTWRSCPHDRGLLRAEQADCNCHSDVPVSKSDSNPYRTVFVGRLTKTTDESDLRRVFEHCGDIQFLTLIRNLVTGSSQGYAFITFLHRHEATRALVSITQTMNKSKINGRSVLVDWERDRLQSHWKPRRLGGGFGGFRNSGQMRFGGRDYKFKRG